MQLVWVDQGYTGTGQAWIEEQLGWRVEVVRHSPRREWMVHLDGRVEKVPARAAFAVLPHRWKVERTFAWFLTNRRLVVDFDELPTSSEARLYLCMIRLMLRRLTRS